MTFSFHRAAAVHPYFTTWRQSQVSGSAVFGDGHAKIGHRGLDVHGIRALETVVF